MIKIDAMTVGAVGFAAFAAWYVMRGGGSTTAVNKGTAASDTVFSKAKEQRNIIGDNTYQNLAYLGGGQGLAPSSGFWAVP